MMLVAPSGGIEGSCAANGEQQHSVKSNTSKMTQEVFE